MARRRIISLYSIPGEIKGETHNNYPKTRCTVRLLSLSSSHLHCSATPSDHEILVLVSFGFSLRKQPRAGKDLGFRVNLFFTGTPYAPWVASIQREQTNSASDTSYRVPVESGRIPFVALQEATNNFDDKFLIAQTGFGKVYRGVLCDGTKVALKRCSLESQQGLAEFRNEIEILSQFNHPHLVSLMGYCDERNEMILAFDYLENGTLSSHLYGSDLPSLSWEQRLEICIDAARGLHYLHTSAVIHRDVKSTNILLDENFVAKIIHFGLSKTGPELDQTHVTTDVKGTFGYIDPEYFKRGRLTEKSDVYGFGVVLFEVLCARPVVVPSLPRKEVILAEWATNWQKKGLLGQIIDPNLLGKIRPNSLRKFGETAKKCLANSGVDRPSMGEVLWNLEYALHLQEAVIQDDPERNSTIPIGEQINDFSHADASSSAAQTETSDSDDLYSDEVISPMLDN